MPRVGFDEHMPARQLTLAQVGGILEFAPAQPVTGKKRVHVCQTTPATDVVHQHWQPGPLVAALLLLTAAMANMQLRLPLNRTAQRRSAGRASSPKLKCRRLPLCNRSNRLSRHQARILRRASIRLSRLVLIVLLPTVFANTI